MRDAETPVSTGLACPACRARVADSALFCARCGAYLKSGRPPDGLNLPLVNLLAEIAQLQRDLLRQFRQGQALQARQFQKALQFQTEQLEKTLRHVSQRTDSTEERLQLWQRWTVGLAAAVIVLVVLAVQLV